MRLIPEQSLHHQPEGREMHERDRSYIRQWRDTLRVMREAGGEPALPSGATWTPKHDTFLRSI
jgi:hypothetical protein